MADEANPFRAALSSPSDDLTNPFRPGEPKFNIDWARPIEEVRTEIAKLPEDKREAALKQWADAFVAKERASVNRPDVPSERTLSDIGTRASDLVRNVARGTLMGSFADEANAATSAAVHKLTGGKYGAPYDESVAYQRALDRAIDKEAPVLSAAEQFSGALGTGAPIAKAVIGTGKGLISKSLKSGVVGGTAGYVQGFGNAEGDIAERNEAALSGPAEAGAALGLAIPPAASAAARGARLVYDAASPTLARAGAAVSALPRRIGLPAMSADGAAPESAGANAAAQQMIANQLSRAGVSVQEIRDRLAQMETARRLDSNSRAADVTALADLDPSLQRLAGSAARASPEAGNTARTFIEGRQTGITPETGSNALAQAGVPTRPMFAQPITGKEAEKTLGSAFGTPQEGQVPMGQGERVLDSFRRALRIKDAELHGHENNAYRTDQAIVAQAKAEAKPAYDAVYKAGGNINVAPAIETVLAKWSVDGPRLANEAEDVKMLVQKMAKAYAPGGKPITNIEKFDKTKQYLDDKIGAYFESSNDRNRYVGGILNEFKNDLLKSVDQIKTNDLGTKYSEARGLYSSRMEARRALQAGRDAFKDNSDVGIDAYNEIANNEGLRKLFRLGLYSGAEAKVKAMPRSNDATRVFATPNVQELLSEVIPRTQSASGEFAKRPERFGQYLGGQKRQIDTRNVVTGNSATAERLRDDQAFDVMSKLGETVEKFKSSPNLVMLGVRAMEHALGKLFGMRSDTAAALARQLFNANPEQRALLLAGVERRLGRDRAAQFAQLMEEYQRQITSAGARLQGNQGSQ